MSPSPIRPRKNAFFVPPRLEICRKYVYILLPSLSVAWLEHKKSCTVGPGALVVLTWAPCEGNSRLGAPARMMCSTLPPNRLDRLACGFVEGQESLRKGKRPAAGREDQKRKETTSGWTQGPEKERNSQRLGARTREETASVWTSTATRERQPSCEHAALRQQPCKECPGAIRI